MMRPRLDPSIYYYLDARQTGLILGPSGVPIVDGAAMSAITASRPGQKVAASNVTNAIWRASGPCLDLSTTTGGGITTTGLSSAISTGATIEWLGMRGGSGWRNGLSTRFSNGTQCQLIEWNPDGDMAFYSNIKGAARVLSYYATLANDTPYWIVGTSDFSGGTQKLYVNGALVATTAITSLGSVDPITMVYVSNNNAAAGNTSWSKINTVIARSRYRDGAEIAANWLRIKSEWSLT